MKILIPNRIRRVATLIQLPLILLGLIWINTPVFAQQSTVVTGRIVSSLDNTAIPGVNILIKGTSSGSVTDSDGKFSIDVPDQSSVLVFSSIGFDTQEVVVGEQAVINVTLKESSTELQELVVVGYGVQERVSVTNSVAEVKGDEVVRRPVSNIGQALQGKLPGVTILDRGGQPGSNNLQIVVRGVNKPYTPVGLNNTVVADIGNNQPLVIVDGIEQPYASVNPADIESVVMLKDASSTAIYGSRGANGVMLLTTKRAKSGKVTVSYSGFVALQQAISVPKAMDIRSYLYLENRAYLNVGGTLPAALPQYQLANVENYAAGTVRAPLKYPLPYDWFNVMYKTAPQVNNTVSISGGNENFKTRLSVRNQNQQGIIANTESKLNDIRLSTDLTISPKIKVSTDINYRLQNSLEPHAINDIFRFMMQNAIWAVPQYPNGVYGGGTQGNSPLLLAENGGLNKTQNDYIFGTVKGDWEIVKGLTFTTQAAIRSNIISNKDFTNTWETRDSVTVKKSNLVNNLTETRIVDREVTWNNLLNYDLKVGEHGIRALLGYSEIYHENSTISAYRQGFYNNTVQSVGQGLNDATQKAGGSDYKWGLRSYFGRLNYSYKGRYLLEVNGRYDGSSRFSPSNQYAFFPSVSGGWRIGEENFFEGLRSTVSELKLRASWGQTGNQAIPFYSFYPSMSAVTYAFGANTVQGYEQKQVIDNNLRWEVVEQTDIGIDGGLFNNHFTFSVDYYKKTTNGVHLTLQIPGAVGLLPNVQNAGVVENAGWEFAIGSNHQIRKFRLSTNLNFNINNNLVKSLAGTGPSIAGDDIDPRYVTGEGYPINGFWGYQTAGLFQTDAEAAAAPVFMRAAKAGDVKIVDRNGDGKITPDDMTFLGNSFPKYTFGGGINVGYGAFNLNIALQGAADVYMRIARALGEAGNFEGFTPDIYTNNYWTPENPNARFARPTKQDLRNQASTDRMLVDASYLRIKNIQLSYSLPTQLIQKIRLQQASVYVSGTNLITFSKLNEWHLDPESSSGWQNYYPQTAVYTLGVNLTF